MDDNAAIGKRPVGALAVATARIAERRPRGDADSDDPLHALGLDCSSLGGAWVDAQNAVAVHKLEWKAAPEQQGMRPWQVARAYGSFIDPVTQKPFWSPREGERLLLMSSGLLPAPDADGAVVIAGNAVYNDVGGAPWDDDKMPPPMSHGHHATVKFDTAISSFVIHGSSAPKPL